MIMGWGTQDEGGFGPPPSLSDRLVTMNVTTTDCASDYYPGLTGTWKAEREEDSEQKIYLCIDAPRNVGGPCEGDNGGDFQIEGH